MGVKRLSSKGGISPPAIERIRAAVMFSRGASGRHISFLGARRRDASVSLCRPWPIREEGGSLANDQ